MVMRKRRIRSTIISASTTITITITAATSFQLAVLSSSTTELLTPLTVDRSRDETESSETTAPCQLLALMEPERSSSSSPAPGAHGWTRAMKYIGLNAVRYK